MNRILGHLLLLFFLCQFGLSSFSQSSASSLPLSKAPDYKALGLKTPVKVMRQWDVDIVCAANLLDYDFSKYADYIEALKNNENLEFYTGGIRFVGNCDYNEETGEFEEELNMEDIDKRLRHIFENGTLKTSYDGETNDVVINQFVDFEGSATFVDTVEYKNGLPSFFKYSYDTGEPVGSLYEYLNIFYDRQGLPVKIIGKYLRSPNEHVPEIFEILISDYKFDDKGNWTQRRLTDGNIKIQFREYEY